jgi:hypothetical protein
VRPYDLGVSLLLGFAAGSVAALLFVTVAYRRKWRWTGFVGAQLHEDQLGSPTRKLWDWLQLLVVPLTLAGAAVAFNYVQNKHDQQREDRRVVAQMRVAKELRQEQTLNKYLGQITTLMLDHGLVHATRRAPVRVVARTITLSALRQLDGKRKGRLVQFLAEAHLIDRRGAKVVLIGADLNGVVLRGGSLADKNLSGSMMMGADFRDTDLSGADLGFSDLRNADFRGAQALTNGTGPSGAPVSPGKQAIVLTWARLVAARFDGVIFRDRAALVFADLRGASFRKATLAHADLSGACMTRANFRLANLNRATLQGQGREVVFAGARIGPGKRGLVGNGINPPGWRPNGARFRDTGGRRLARLCKG